MGILLPAIVTAEERTLTPEQMEALAKTGGEIIDETPERPAKLPDLTKGDPIPIGKDKPEIWSLGPTGSPASWSAVSRAIRSRSRAR